VTADAVDRIAGTIRDDRCCGDHPGDWDRPALPGHSFCQECLDRSEPCPTCDDRGLVAQSPGQPGDGYTECPDCRSEP
jgi:hypothetical protein